MPEIDVKEKYQNLIEQLNEGLNLDPKYVERFFISNIVNRVISYLMAFDVTTNLPIRLRATKDGCLKVALVGAGFNYNQTFSGKSTDTETTLEFSHTVSRVDIWVENNDMIIKRSSDGVSYDDEITLRAGTFYSFDCVTKSIQVKNATTGADADYQIVGWY